MPPETDLTQWSPAAVIAVAAGIATALGSISGVISGFYTGKGLEVRIRWAKFREEQKEREAKREMERKKQELETKNPFSTEQVWEDKQLNIGYKDLLKQWDSRVREMEERNQKLETSLREVQAQLMNCVTEHAEVRTTAAGLKEELQRTERAYRIISKRFDRLRRKLNISEDELKGGDDDDNFTSTDTV